MQTKCVLVRPPKPVYRWVQRIREDQDPLRDRRVAACGRKRALKEENVQEITNFVRENPFSSLATIKEEVNVQCSEKLFSTDMGSRTPLWRLPNGRYQPQNVLRSRRSGRITLGLWGWMSSAGPGELVQISPHMNSEEYINILQNTMLPGVKEVYGEINPILFIQHNSAVHKSRLVQEWFMANPQIVPINWPPRSPDLNPIENLWAAVAQQWNAIENGPIQIRNTNQLEAHANRVWERHRGLNVCENLYFSATEKPSTPAL
ncbi:hypothetical protein ILUMI_26207 [Ignelater luminosus]|uniref:Tc1-like transposase DDE domain-containing protein n=1 Tax=Ignelater luminosus TaxID=2038154 RepID=A0A8K0C6X8_IGNLU|nr:hypothetical protein ILUMI_26207 [Ignelater luminosus]